MHLFYAPNISGDSLVLNEQESKHAVRVLRLQQGDRVVLVDGRGGWYDALLEEVASARCKLSIIQYKKNFQPLPYHLHLAISPTKSTDRFEWFLEKATEIGISEVTPLICNRTERIKLRHERLERIVVSAMKQSLRAYKPFIHELTALDSFLASNRNGILGIAHCMPGVHSSIRDLPASGNYTLLVGPEGDFTEEEVANAIKAGYRPFRLGPSRLRTETAGIHIVSAIQLLHLH